MHEEKNMEEEQKDLAQRIAELESVVLKHVQSENTLRHALRKEYDDQEKRIMNQTTDLIEANKQLRQEIEVRERAESELHYRVEFERLITAISNNFIRLFPDKIDNAINGTLKTIGEFVGVDRSYVLLFSETEAEISSIYEWCVKGVPSQNQNLKDFLVDDKFPWFAEKIKMRRVFHLSYSDSLPPEANKEKEYLQIHGIQSIIVVPMFCGRSFIGCMGFDSIRVKKKWAVDIIALLRIIGEIFANALVRKKMDIALSESENKYRLLFEHASDGIALLDTNGNILDYNNAYIKLFGFAQKDIVGKPLSMFFVEEGERLFQKGFPAIEEEGRADFEFDIIRKPGETIPVWCKVTALYDEYDKFKGALAHFIDITERKQSEDILRKAHHEMEKRVEEHKDNLITIKTQLDQEIAGRKRAEYETEIVYTELDQIFNTAADGMGVIDIDFNLLHTNKTLLEMFGINENEFAKKKCYQLFSSSLCHTVNCPLSLIFMGKERIEREIEIHCNAGKIPCILTATPFKDHDGKLIGIIEDFKDVTEYKKTQDMLSNQVLRNERLLDVYLDGFFMIDAGGSFIEVNEAFSDLLGYSKDELLHMKIGDLEVKKESGESRSMITGRNRSKRFATSYYHKNGSIINLEISTSLVEFGKDIFYVSSVRDITERKNTERRLQFLSSVFDQSTEGIALVDLEGNVLFTNNAYASLHGHTPEELSGKHLFYLLKPIQKQYLGIYEQQIKNEEEFSDETWYAKSDGKLFPAQISASFLRDESDRPFGKVIKIKDITEKMRFTDTEGYGFKGRNDLTSDNVNAEKAEEAGIMDQDKGSFRYFQGMIKNQALRDHSILGQLPAKTDHACCVENICSRSEKIGQIFAILPSVAQSVSTVLIQGESGTGKHLFAHAIHSLSPRKGKPFIVLNCGAFPDTLLESELFGYKAGAFTDAKKDKQGRFALADGGTLFLDEIGDISPAMQVRLLRFLQERVYEPLGSIKSVKVDVRIIAATNKDLMNLVQEGKFRQDLFYRINVVRIDLPPLRERLEDIPILVDQFISRLNLQQGKKVTGITEEALMCLLSYDYPGNIRELENIIERAFVISNSGKIKRNHLPEAVYTFLDNYHSDKQDLTPLMKMEAVFLMNILKQNNWNRIETAKQLGIHKSTLFRKIKSLGLKLPHQTKQKDS